MSGHSFIPAHDDAAYQHWRFKIDGDAVARLKQFSSNWGEFDSALRSVLKMKADTVISFSINDSFSQRDIYRLVAEHIWSGKLVVIGERLDQSPHCWLLTPAEIRLGYAKTVSVVASGYRQDVVGRSTVAEETERQKTPSTITPKAQHWLQIEIFDHVSGGPVAGVNLQVNLPEGSPSPSAFHRSDTNGRIALYNLKAGMCGIECAVTPQSNKLTKINTLAYVGTGKPDYESDSQSQSTGRLTATTVAQEEGYHIARVEEYRVKAGDTLKSIADEFGLSVDQITQFNWQTTDLEQVNRHLIDEMGAPTGVRAGDKISAKANAKAAGGGGTNVTSGTTTGDYVTFSGEEEQPLLMVARPWQAPKLTTQQTLQLQVKPVVGPLHYFSIRLHDDDGVELCDLPYILVFNSDSVGVGQRFDGVTDRTGSIKHVVASDVGHGTLLYWSEKDNPDSIVVKEIDVGFLGKSMETIAVNKRLTNLGYLNQVTSNQATSNHATRTLVSDKDAGDNSESVYHEEALARFKSRHGLSPHASDDAVQQKLISS